MLLALIPSLTSFSNYGYFYSEIVPVHNSNLTLAYTSHAPINITSNSDFETQSWPGEGISTDPYLISGLNITSTSPVCILIANTTSYFTITECLFSSQENDWGHGIISLENVIHGLVEDNVFVAGYIAISVEDSSSCSFVGNTIGTSLMGFLAYNLNNSEFSRNTQSSESMGYPVHIEDGNNLIIRSNFFQDCAYEGIGLTSCTDCLLEDNVITGLDLHLGQYGFAIRNSKQCTFVRNNITGCGTGIDITNGELHAITDNYIQLCFGGVMLRVDNDTIINDNEIISIGYCVSLLGTFRNIVQSNELQSSSQGNGIEVDGGANSNITENIFNQHDSGVRILETTNLRVSNNNFSNCFAAILLEDNAYIGQDGPPIDCKIVDNNFGDSGIRFSISNPAFMDHEITGNLVNGRQYAYLYEATNIDIDGRDYGRIILASCEDISITGGLLDELLVMFSSNCEITGVSIVNKTDGIYVRYSNQIVIGYSELVGNDVGVRLEWSNFCLVMRTTAYNNGHGILLDSSPNSTVYDCDLYDNEYGMVLIGAHQSNIESNRIYRNNQGIYLLRTEEAYIGNNDVLENYEIGLLLNRGSRFNRIIANSFGWNSVNVMCLGFDNVWDDGVKLGNRWSDLGGAIVYIIDEDDTDRFPSLLGDENTTTLPVSTNNGTSNAVESEIGALVVGAVAGFGLLGLFAVAVSVAKRRK